ncbi:MAG TPA: GntR family transcriptional regulator [Phenylobacterium sp.]|nr:GntR family transcriptional regulator [Phenylobacterium sp.]
MRVASVSLNRDQSTLVLAALRARLRAGEWIEGEPLTVSELATECGVSQTPVREVLARLAGEGLVEERRGRGYHARRIDSAELADLYRAQKLLTRVAVASRACQRAPEPLAFGCRPDDFLTHPVSTWEALFDALITRANSGFLRQDQKRLANLLAPARRIEPSVLGETSADFTELVTALAKSDWPTLDSALERLLQRRRAAVEDLVVRMRLDVREYKVSI